jgi:riboflavin-specific deaminase-like protein
MAMTADGKIATANQAVSSFGSARDHEHLLELRAKADAVMCGARTVELSVVTLGPGPARFRRLRLKRGLNEFNLRVIVSGSGTINPRARIFEHRFSPILLLTTARAGKRQISQLADVADEVRICGEKEIDFSEALSWLRQKWKVNVLLCEGGGQLNSALFRAGLVDELHLTLCPKVFGGRQAPTIADGVGVERLADAASLQLKSMRRVRDELFLVYRAAQ